MKHLVTLAALIIITPAAMAEDYHQHDAHEHGVGELNIALAGNQLGMELTAPGADIVGFEYQASSEADKLAVHKALQQLRKPQALIALPSEAQCALISAEAHLDGGDHEEEHHDEHEEDKHTSFHAEYLFQCSDMSALQNFSFPYFQIFPNALELEVQIVNDKGARAFEVERAEPQLEL
jgi:hypothetical protein